MTPRLTASALNLALGFLGLAIIWQSTHNWTAILGGIVAGIHITVRAGRDRS